MKAPKIAVHRTDLEKAARELDEGILFLVDFESMLPDHKDVDIDHLHAARRLLASARLTVHGELDGAARCVTPLPNLGEDEKGVHSVNTPGAGSLRHGGANSETTGDSREKGTNTVGTSGDPQPVAFTDAQVDYLRGMLDVAHQRVFHEPVEARSGASPVEAMLNAALHRAAGATVQKLPLNPPGTQEASDDPDDDAARELVRFTTEQLLNQLHGRIQVLEGIAEGRGWDDETFLLALRGCFGRKPKKSEAAQ